MNEKDEIEIQKICKNCIISGMKIKKKFTIVKCMECGKIYILEDWKSCPECSHSNSIIIKKVS